MNFFSKKARLLPVVMVLGVLLWAAGAASASDTLQCQVFCPDFKNNTLVDIHIVVYNQHDHDISFNKIAIMYMNPSLSFKGPYVINQVNTVKANSSLPITISSFRMSTTAPLNTIVPIAVLLWDTYFTAGYERGGGAGAALRVK
jgi:hypothetical protein